jgi:hypothetical protein
MYVYLLLQLVFVETVLVAFVGPVYICVEGSLTDRVSCSIPNILARDQIGLLCSGTLKMLLFRQECVCAA